mgnify:CR=1 FL=1
MVDSDSDSILSHLIELRDRLLRCVVSFLIVFVCLFPWARDIYTVLAEPLLSALPVGGQMIATEVVSPFFVPIKVTMLAALVLVLPYLLYQFWAFVAPGLYTKEKNLVFPLIVTSTLLFIVGMAFAFYVVFPVVFHFITSIAPDGVAVMTDIQKYLDFVITLFIAFGLTFEVPIAVVILTRAGILTVQKLKDGRPYVIVGAFVIGAIFTPPDVISQILLAIPLWFLYEAGILVSLWLGSKKEESA